MEKKELTCIGCPMGCALNVTMEDGKVVKVEGNTCKRGDVYARKEVTDPTRIVCSSVPVAGGYPAQVSVKTSRDIAKSKIFDVMRAIKNVKCNAPVKIGDILVKNVAGTGADIIATKDIEKTN
jgi:CxxC motif-containing protein